MVGPRGGWGLEVVGGWGPGVVGPGVVGHI